MAKSFTEEPNYEAVVSSLLEKTLKNKIAWEKTDESTKFRATVGESISFVVFLYIMSAEEGEAAVILRMYGADEEPIFAVSTTTPEFDESVHENISQIYTLADRISGQVDSKIDEALQFLKKA